jgi:L-lactate dehydrogenase (cytochrome)
MNGFYWPRGELAVARAAMEAGLIHAVSAFASVAMEDIAALGPARRWFQLYPLTDHGVLDDLMARAKAAAFEALCVTVDAPVVGLRKRDVRNGVQFPPKLSASLILSALSKPAWAAPFMMGYRPEFANLKGYRIDQRPDARGVSTPELDAAFAWADLARIARVWDGPVIVKGVMHVDDARAARDSGATAIVVSNHGGRQCDAAPATLEALSTIAAAALEGLELLVDGGVSSGLDVLKYRHAGARACLVGRAVLYGLASTGQRGAAAALSILKTDLRNAAILAGVSL